MKLGMQVRFGIYNSIRGDCLIKTIFFNRLIAEDANTRQLRKIDNRGGRENASKMRLRVHFALELCGVKEATNHNCRRFYIVVSIF